MSDNWLRFIPSDPMFQPASDAASAAVAFLQSYTPLAQHVEARFLSEVTFIDPGGNWSGVACSACGADAEPWWSDAMSAAADRKFRDLMITAGCCGATVSLNELRYHWPVAFGCFVLEAMNPNIADISPAQKQQISEALGCSIRTVKVHL
jgi:hypothetical protein